MILRRLMLNNINTKNTLTNGRKRISASYDLVQVNRTIKIFFPKKSIYGIIL